MIYGENYECRSCKYWNRQSPNNFSRDDEYGICSGLPGSMMEIELITGYEGGYGYVDRIETKGNFYCALYEDK